MKKFFKKAFVVLGIAGMGLGTTSCDSEILSALLPIVMENVLPGLLNPGGKTATYNGTITVDSYTCTDNQYHPDTKESYTGAVDAQAIISEKDGVVTIKLGTFKVGSNTISDFTFNTNYKAQGGVVGDGNDAYYEGGTCTLNGKAATAIESACFVGTVNENTLSITFFDFYVGGKKYEGKFSGSVQAQ